MQSSFRFRTWHAEHAVVLAILAATAVFAGRNRTIEWIGVLAVYFTFSHASVANRLEEHQALRVKQRGTADVECYRWTTRYFVAKEICWFVYFLLLGAYSALAGVVIFLMYPLWRRYWRSIHPLDRLASDHSVPPGSVRQS